MPDDGANTRKEPNSADAGQPPQAPDEHDVIPLAPAEPAAPSKYPKMPAGKPDLGAPPLLDDVDDDADLTHDPEVERALKGGAATADDTAAGEPAVREQGPPVVKDGKVSPKTLAIIGGVVTLAAIVVSVINAPAGKFAAAVSATYLTLFHTVTGVGAVAILAYAENRPTGRIEVAAGRMFIAVASFMLVLSLHFDTLQGFNGAVMSVFAALSYYLVAWTLFRLPQRQMQILAGAHAGIAILLWLLVQVHWWASNAGMMAATQPAK
ncbi:MAG: hypothetical protein GC200_03645 [Tepidisphaera sp.]|nr:hypothetical protein [Tepidisphaera sp.]